MSDTGPDLMAVNIDYGDGTTEELVITDGYSSVHLYDDEVKYTVEVTEIELTLEVTSISPDTAVMGGADVTLTVTGTGFSPESVILFNGGAETTVRISSTELTTIVKPLTAQVAGSYPVAVYRSEDESTSNEMDFTFTEEVVVPEEEPPDEYDPDAPARDYASEIAYNPANHTVTEVIGYVEDNPGELEAVLALEEEGKARTTLISHLEGMRP